MEGVQLGSWGGTAADPGISLEEIFKKPFKLLKSYPLQTESYDRYHTYSQAAMHREE